MYKRPHFWNSVDIYLPNTKNQLVSWFNGKSDHHGISIIDSNIIVIIKKYIYLISINYGYMYTFKNGANKAV